MIFIPSQVISHDSSIPSFWCVVLNLFLMWLWICFGFVIWARLFSVLISVCSLLLQKFEWTGFSRTGSCIRIASCICHASMEGGVKHWNKELGCLDLTAVGQVLLFQLIHIIIYLTNNAFPSAAYLINYLWKKGKKNFKWL